ncbi:hypothetical protein ACIQGZ_14065 [Streptomyces sp. NPDC092296]|uniref:hypothetical protein n=1 Tax=Streptomyces sp. NPDC092296 TaxID=3366012 RepID=UPI0037FE7453
MRTFPNRWPLWGEPPEDERRPGGPGGRSWTLAGLPAAVREAVRNHRTDEDRADFDALYAAAAEPLTRTAFLLTGDRARAVDRVGRAFAAAWGRWPEVAADPEPERWVRRALFEDVRCTPWRRFGRLGGGGREPDREGADREGADRLTEVDRVLLAALRELPGPQRGALVLHDVLGLDVMAVAAPDAVGGDPAAEGFGERLGGLLRAAAQRGCEALPRVPADLVRRRCAVRTRATTGAAGALLLAAAVTGLATVLGVGPSHFLRSHGDTADPAPSCAPAGPVGLVGTGGTGGDLGGGAGGLPDGCAPGH